MDSLYFLTWLFGVACGIAVTVIALLLEGARVFKMELVFLDEKEKTDET